ncbi:hypothetical protein J6590_010400 [Homalodisca vitripennis]|nr:hypothetical protein J6590_010400 [Homalodisca vitripennis]
MDVGVTTIKDWNITSVRNENLANEQIIDIIVQRTIAEEDLHEEEKEEDVKISHYAVKNPFKIPLKNIHQQLSWTLYGQRSDMTQQPS